VQLTWGESCHAPDTTYAVYEGLLGDFTSHVWRDCDTLGATTATFTPGSAGRYYIVTPTNGVEEGSYGNDSSGNARPQGAGACLPRSVVVCQ
jgi:hypothetical protein